MRNPSFTLLETLTLAMSIAHGALGGSKRFSRAGVAL
jgi:hypothetical protein